MVEEPVLFSPMNLDVRARNVAMGMASLDGVDFAEIFKQRARVMWTVPLVSEGGIPKRNAGGSRRSAMRQRQERRQ